ncbi:MAG: hypothetical protein PHY45_06745 [Rhodocyclaceae bacterium]|nr:hypothetical protein [Rhodocyclaceae bacterium]
MDAFYIESLEMPTAATSPQAVGTPMRRVNIFSFGFGLAVIMLCGVGILNVLAVGHFIDGQSGIANVASIASRLSVFGRELDAAALWDGLFVADILFLALAVLLIRQAATEPNGVDKMPPPIS